MQCAGYKTFEKYLPTLAPLVPFFKTHTYFPSKSHNTENNMYSYEQILALDTQPGEVAIQQQRNERQLADTIERQRAENEERGIKYTRIGAVDGETVKRANDLRYRFDCAEYDQRVGSRMVADGQSLIAQGESLQARAAIARERAEAELVETLGANWRELLSSIRPLPLRGH